MQNTKLVYLENSLLERYNSSLLAINQIEAGQCPLILTETIFYPQGGGQPYDTGEIINSKGDCFVVEKVKFENGLVHHIGTFKNPDSQFVPQENLTLQINKKLRDLHSKLHSAGHLIDKALRILGCNFTPSKGFHYPEGSYVEYITQPSDKIDLNTLPQKLENEVNHMIQEAFEVQTEIISNSSQLTEMCDFIPPNLPTNKPIRVVTVYGQKGLPCGGTHVQNIKEIGEIRIVKVKWKQDILRLSYGLV